MVEAAPNLWGTRLRQQAYNIKQGHGKIGAGKDMRVGYRNELEADIDLVEACRIGARHYRGGTGRRHQCMPVSCEHELALLFAEAYGIAQAHLRCTVPILH